MSDGEHGSVSRWIGDLKAGDGAAAQPLWERYFARLVRLARAKLRMARRGAAEDEEDAALSAFNSFCAGAAQGGFPSLPTATTSGGCWSSSRPARPAPRCMRQARQKRGGGRVLGEADFPGEAADGPLCRRPRAVIGAEPTPEFAAMVAEEYRRLLDGLGDDDLRQVAARPDGRLHQRRDRRAARLRPADRGPPARPDPQDLGGGGDLMDVDRPDARPTPRRSH